MNDGDICRGRLKRGKHRRFWRQVGENGAFHCNGLCGLELPKATRTFAPSQQNLTPKRLVMADHIDNVGKKGRFVMWSIIYFLLFILLLIYLYRYNFKFLPS